MDLKYVNPFVASAVSVIKEVVGVTAAKKQIYVTKGKESLGGVSIFFSLTGDAEGQIIFDLPPGISTTIAKEMIGLNLEEAVQDDEQKDLFKSAITELGNMISGSAITKLEEHNYDCDIKPPQVYVGPKTKLTHPSMSTIVIEMNTDVGDFSINLVNKKERYVDNIAFLMIKMNEDFVEEVVKSFIPKGLFVYSCTDIDPQGKYYIREKNIDFALIDVDQYLDSLDSTINSIREISKNENLKIISASSKRDRDFLLKIQQLGVAGFLLKDQNPSTMLAKLQDIFRRLGVKLNEKRKQLTVDVDPDSKFKINIKFPEYENPIIGSITRIGVGGVAFTVTDDTLGNFVVHQELKDIQLNLKGKYLLVDGVISAIHEGKIAIKFTAVKDKFIGMLADTVFEKISSF